MKKIYSSFIFSFFVAVLVVLSFNACTNDKDDEPSLKLPTNLSYNPSSKTAVVGTAISSSQPTVTGTTPITYSMTVAPNASTITINTNTGVVTASNTTAEGSYKVSIAATNGVGKEDFANALTINITAAGGGGNKITFDANVKSLLTTKCAPCHVSGGGNTNYSVYSAAKGNISGILNRVNRTQGSTGFMPQGRTKLSTAEIATLTQWQTDGLLEN